MRTFVEITARPGRRPHLRAEGGLAARETGRDVVHLVSTAATPVGGDSIEVVVTVLPGARLELLTVAATVVYPGLNDVGSSAQWRFRVGDDAEFTFAPKPTIVAAAATHTSRTEVDLSATATAVIGEQAQIGRVGEAAIGAWESTLRVDLDAVPHVRHRFCLGAGDPLADSLGAPMAYLSQYRFPDVGTTSATSVPPRADASVLPLARGGTLSTVTGPTVARLAGELTLVADAF